MDKIPETAGHTRHFQSWRTPHPPPRNIFFFALRLTHSFSRGRNAFGSNASTRMHHFIVGCVLIIFDLIIISSEDGNEYIVHSK